MSARARLDEFLPVSRLFFDFILDNLRIFVEFRARLLVLTNTEMDYRRNSFRNPLNRAESIDSLGSF